jgi:dihydroorotase
MNILIKGARIIDPGSKWNGKKMDLRIQKGIIEEIGTKLDIKNEKLFEESGCMVSPGWIDMNVHFRDPGEEYKEDLASGLAAAREGGFTSVVTMPSTHPAIDSKSSVEYIKQKSWGSGVHVFPAAALSKKLEGQELSEMVDLHEAGAALFTDDEHPVMDSNLMKKALLYAKNIDGTVCSFPQDHSIASTGVMNEGPLSTLMGVRGIPHIAETMLLKRDIDLLRYTASKLHVVGLSTAEGVKLIREAKKEGLAITAEVFMANLLWTDGMVDGYKSLYKLCPPLRTEKDRKALIKGVNEGTIDCISSNHRPEDVEHKKVEFGQASTGIAMLESVYPLYQSHLSEEIPLERFITAITDGPCTVLGIPPARIEKGKKAILTCFSSSGKPSAKPVFSKAFNTPSIQLDMKGKVHFTLS